MSAELTPDGLRAIAERFQERHRTGVLRALMVAGSGIRLELPGWQAGDEITLAEVLPFRLHELPGHRQTMTLWRRGPETILAMNGRLHLYQGYSPAEVVAPVRLAGLLGAGLMLATNATGALDPAIPPGSMVVVSDHINLQPGVSDNVERADSVTVTALDENGARFTLNATGLLATCIHHQLDHLQGKVFVEHLSELKQNRIRAKLKKRQRKAA